MSVLEIPEYQTRASGADSARATQSSRTQTKRRALGAVARAARTELSASVCGGAVDEIDRSLRNIQIYMDPYFHSLF